MEEIYKSGGSIMNQNIQEMNQRFKEKSVKKYYNMFQ